MKPGFEEDTEVIDFFAPPRAEFLLGGKPSYMTEGNQWGGDNHTGGSEVE